MYERKAQNAKQGGDKSPKRQESLTERKVLRDPNKPLTYKQRKSFSKNKALRAEQGIKSFRPRSEYRKDNTAPERNTEHASSNLETGNWRSASSPKRSFDKPTSSRTWNKPSDKPRWDKKSNDFKSPMSQSASKPKRDFKGPRKEYGPKTNGQKDFRGPRQEGPKREFTPRDNSSRGPRPEGQRDFKGPRKDFGPKKDFSQRSEAPKRDFSAPKTDRREEFFKTDKKKVDKSKYFKYGNNR